MEVGRIHSLHLDDDGDLALKKKSQKIRKKGRKKDGHFASKKSYSILLRKAVGDFCGFHLVLRNLRWAWPY